MLCVTGVYLREIINTIFVILHLNLSRLECLLFLFINVLKNEVSVKCTLSFREKVYPGLIFFNP